MSDNRHSFSSVLAHVGDDWYVTCSTYADRPPILAVDAGHMSVNFSIRDREADENAMNFARALLKRVQTFADEIERLHAEQTAADAADHAKLPEPVA